MYPNFLCYHLPRNDIPCNIMYAIAYVGEVTINRNSHDVHNILYISFT